jgi:uncharacterized Zn-binding protein involved in type VI secretion
MGQPLAKQGDTITAVDMHLVLVPTPAGPAIPNPLPHPFNGIINGNLSTDVFVGGVPAATVGSIAINNPPHIPTPPGVSFVIPPTNQATIMMGSATVRINGKMAARNNDTAQSCGDPVPNMNARVIAVGTVMVGG